MDVGLRINYLRKASNITMQQLSLLTGISQPVLSKLENGIKIPDVPNIEKICNALNVSLADFFKEDTPEIPPHIADLIKAAKELPKADIEALTRLIKKD